jgi:hypothetical protein
VEEVIALGGDADSTGAVVGGIAGATVGVAGIPARLRPDRGFLPSTSTDGRGLPHRCGLGVTGKFIEVMPPG